MQVAAAVARDRPDAHFVVFGRGDLQAEMRRAARGFGLEGRLRMPGLTSASFSALSAMDVVLLTSMWEGTPNVALEAQWCGVPVVVTSGGGSVEAIEHGVTGWVVDDVDAAAIAARVVATLNDDAARRRARETGHQFVSRTFGFDRMIADTLATYRLAPS
jgi:glycosyltransferase involved in cell wall biosynthesis